MLGELSLTPEENELKNKISRKLEEDGFLGNIRAQMRVAVLRAMDTDSEYKYYMNKDIKKNIKMDETEKLILMLIKEYLDFYKLEQTACIFVPESQLEEEEFKKRNSIIKQYNLQSLESNEEKPILVNLLDYFRMKNDIKKDIKYNEKYNESNHNDRIQENNLYLNHSSKIRLNDNDQTLDKNIIKSNISTMDTYFYQRNKDEEVKTLPKNNNVNTDLHTSFNYVKESKNIEETVNDDMIRSNLYSSSIHFSNSLPVPTFIKEDKIELELIDKKPQDLVIPSYIKENKIELLDTKSDDLIEEESMDEMEEESVTSLDTEKLNLIDEKLRKMEEEDETGTLKKLKSMLETNNTTDDEDGRAIGITNKTFSLDLDMKETEIKTTEVKSKLNISKLNKKSEESMDDGYGSDFEEEIISEKNDDTMDDNMNRSSNLNDKIEINHKNENENENVNNNDLLIGYDHIEFVDQPKDENALQSYDYIEMVEPLA